MRKLTAVIAGLLCAAAHPGAQAQQDWPRKVINLIVPNAVGGAYDAAARPLGLALAQALLRERPGVGVLYMSGYMEKSMLLGKHPESILLQKPFTPEVLIAAVRRIFASEDQA